MEPHEQTVWSPMAYRARKSRREAGIVRGGSGKDPRTREVAGEFLDADAARSWFQVGEALITRGTPTIKKTETKNAGQLPVAITLAILSKHPALRGYRTRLLSRLSWPCRERSFVCGP